MDSKSAEEEFEVEDLARLTPTGLSSSLVRPWRSLYGSFGLVDESPIRILPCYIRSRQLVIGQLVVQQENHTCPLIPPNCQ